MEKKMENEMEKKMENEMETGVMKGLYWGYSILWAVLKIMGPFWFQNILRHLISRSTKVGP